MRLQYMPCFFFGALLVWFGVEISRDWLVLSYYKLTGKEYAILWLTFAFVMQVGVCVWGGEERVRGGERSLWA